MTALPTLKLRVLPAFPSSVIGSGPITITKTAGIYTISFSISSFGSITPLAADYPTDFVMGYNSLTGEFFKISLSNLGIGGQRMPQGRLTLTSGTAVMTSNVAGATTLYYTPAAGRFVPIWNGIVFINADIGGELSQTTTDATKSPAAVAASQLYDIFIWNDAGTIRATRGPPWATGGGSATARGTGAGSTALTMLNGILVNTNAITNGPAANFGTYVGTIMSDGSSQLNMVFGGASAGGTAALLGVWNAYNREPVAAKVSDTTANWTYNSATPRQVNASATNRVTLVSGLAVDAIFAAYSDGITLPATSGAFALIGFVMDAVASFDRSTGGATPTANLNFIWPCQSGSYTPKLGQHFIQAIEQSSAGNTTTFGGDGSANTRQQLEVTFLM